MRAFLTLSIYIVPFVFLGVVVRRWMGGRVGLPDVQAEGDPARKRSRFLLGIWRHEQRK
jgi:hypothetical protein